MANIKRYLEEKISGDIKRGKILIIYGARQVGKTTLIRKYATLKTIALNGDFIDDREKISDPTRKMVEQFKHADRLIIDEAQNIPDIGIKLKVIFDSLPYLSIIVTGSSSFDLSNKINEPLTGRHISYRMFPFSYSETKELFDLHSSIIFGMYPDVFLEKNNNIKEELIKRISQNYLFKDVLNIEYIKNPKSLESLLKVLAAQLGNEVSAHEISNTLDIDTKTVSKYIDILEKLFIIFPLSPFTSNIRKTITKKQKYYFYDIGIRNSILSDFSGFENRKDKGAIWENFCILERMKFNEHRNFYPQYGFFRRYDGLEIDFIEKHNDKVNGFEFKCSADFVDQKIQKVYSQDIKGEGSIRVIHTENYKEFLT